MESLFALRIAGLGSGRCPLASKNETNAWFKCRTAFCEKKWKILVRSCGSIGFSRRFHLSSWAGCYSLPKYTFLKSSLHSTIPFKWPNDRALHSRVISPRQPPLMVLEVYVLARTKYRIPIRDTSPADRSLRFRAMTGTGLMARDTIICTEICTLRH